MANAEAGAKRTHPAVALQAWWHDLDGLETAVETGVKGAAGFGVAVAGAAIAAAGVAAGAVTFGIGPALGLVVGLSLSKSMGEVKYQRASSRLRRAVQTEGVIPMENLSDAMSKVLKKYLRVARRAKMLGGGAKGAAYNLRHLKTTIKAQFGSAAVGAKRVSTKYDDRDLNERLLEFRYYGQMTLNTLNEYLEIVIDRFSNLQDQAGTTYVHVMRQAHFTGNHGPWCTEGSADCYTMPQDEFRQNVSKLRPAPDKGNVFTRGYHKTQHFKQVRAELQGKPMPQDYTAYPGRPRAAINSRHILENLRSAQEAGEFEASITSTADLLDPADRATELASGVTADALAGGATKHGISTQGATSWAGELGEAGEPVGEAMGGVAASTGIGLGLDILAGTVKERITRRLARRRVLGNKQNIENLFQAKHDEDDVEIKNLIALIQSNDKAHALRVVEKIVWYGTKIHNLESDRDYMALRNKVNTTNFTYSVFGSCKEAYECWQATHYLIRQYQKLITNIVFLEIILFQLDRKIATMDIGVTAGNLISEGAVAPVRPAHMKDID